MARLEEIDFIEQRLLVDGELVTWEPDPNVPTIMRLPQIFWKDGRGWWEANHWAIERARNTRGSDLQTIKCAIKHLLAYANWLEENDLDWREIPIERATRPIVKFRGYLIKQRDSGALRGKTPSERMRAVIAFHRHCLGHHLLSTDGTPWSQSLANIKYINKFGAMRNLQRLTTDLSIPYRPRHGLTLEDGLIPMSVHEMNQLLAFLQESEMIEQYLMWSLGFFSGARIETICTLRTDSILQSLPDPTTKNIFLVPVGPGTGVQTKFDVEGPLHIVAPLRKELIAYAESVRRIQRSQKATEENRNCLFLTQRGNPYVESSRTRLMTKLRRDAVRKGLTFMANAKFHQSRATFCTNLLEALLDVTTVAQAVGELRAWALHKDEATSLKYVTFRENRSTKAFISDRFSQLFSGVKDRDWNQYEA